MAQFNPLDEFWCYSWGGDGIPTLLHKENGKLNIFVELDKLLESFRNETLLFTFKNCTCKFLGLLAVNSNSCRLDEYGKAEICIFPKTCQFWLIVNLKIYFTKNKTFCCRNLLKRVKEECFFCLPALKVSASWLWLRWMFSECTFLYLKKGKTLGGGGFSTKPFWSGFIRSAVCGPLAEMSFTPLTCN